MNLYCQFLLPLSVHSWSAILLSRYMHYQSPVWPNDTGSICIITLPCVVRLVSPNNKSDPKSHYQQLFFTCSIFGIWKLSKNILTFTRYTSQRKNQSASERLDNTDLRRGLLFCSRAQSEWICPQTSRFIIRCFASQPATDKTVLAFHTIPPTNQPVTLTYSAESIKFIC